MSVATTSHPLSDPATAGFIPIPRGVLRSIEDVHVDLFIRHEDQDQLVLFREAKYDLSQARADDLKRNCRDVLYVAACDFGPLSKLLMESLEEIVNEESLSRVDRFEVLQTAVAVEVEQSLRLVNNDRFLQLSSRVGQQISSLMSSGEVVPRELYRIARHDFSTFAHVTNVASYAVVLAMDLGLRDDAQLEQIAIGGMIHDLGKRFIPQSILTKPASLTPEEREMIQTHPQRGYEEVVDREDLSFGQLMMIYQHHEHLDGKGYPVCVTGEEIHPWAKLLAVVDVFDALTGKRPYRRPLPVVEALEFISSRVGSQFDKEMAGCWVSAMQRK